MLTMKTAILIEGANGVRDNAQNDFSKVLSTQPALFYLKQLADINNLAYFDPITSMDVEHFRYAFSKFKPDQHERVVHSILDFFRGQFQQDLLVLKLFIIPAYQQYCLSANIPTWLSTLSQRPQEIAKHKENMMIKLYSSNKFKSPTEGYEKEKAAIIEWLMSSSNNLSRQKLNDHLEKNPEIERVIGLVGASHLNFADKLGEVLPAGFGRIVRCKIKERPVEIILFGGLHSNLAAYNMLAKYVQKLGYSIPALIQSEQGAQNDMVQLINAYQPSLVQNFERLTIQQKAAVDETKQEVKENKGIRMNQTS